jgi:hypothetical protein
MTSDEKVISTQCSIPIGILGFQAFHIIINNNGHILIRYSLHRAMNFRFEATSSIRTTNNAMQHL